MEICNIIATGCSLKNIDIDKIEGYKIGVNHTHKYFKLDELVWWDKEVEAVKLPNYNVHTLDVRTIRGNNIIKWTPKGLGINRILGHISNQNSSVSMAINIAINKGFTKIFLFGVDNCLTNGYLHFYDKEKLTGCNKTDWINKVFPMFERFYSNIQNALIDEKIYTIDSAIKSFINITFDDYKRDF